MASATPNFISTNLYIRHWASEDSARSESPKDLVSQGTTLSTLIPLALASIDSSTLTTKSGISLACKRLESYKIEQPSCALLL